MNALLAPPLGHCQASIQCLLPRNHCDQGDHHVTELRMCAGSPGRCSAHQFCPIHRGEKRVRFDVFHTGHSSTQTLQGVELQELKEKDLVSHRNPTRESKENQGKRLSTDKLTLSPTVFSRKTAVSNITPAVGYRVHLTEFMVFNCSER